MSWIKRGLKDRFIHINAKTDTVVYLPQGKERTLSNPEESVQLQTYLELIYAYGYPPEKVRVCEKVKIGSSTREADIVVYNDRQGKDPYIIIECKKERISDKVFAEAVDQGFSYAAVTNAEYVFATSGDRHAAYEVFHHAINERSSNRIKRLPKHAEEKKLGFALRRRLGWLFRHPIIADTILYGVVLILSTLLFSKIATEFHDQIHQYTEWLWEKHGMTHLWIFNVIVLLATLFSMVLGIIFMRSHRMFGSSAFKKRVVWTLIALILFVPVWFVGTSMSDPNWWQEASYQTRKYPIITYLWPYVKSIPFQLAAIYALIWLMGRRKNT